jgi:hypothetical protein
MAQVHADLRAISGNGWIPAPLAAIRPSLSQK